MTRTATATADSIPIPGQRFEYGFDDIGNRTSTKAGGNAAGTGLRSSTYAVNSLNQYTNRTVPGAFDVLGIANAQESVTVNGSAADYRRGEYFQELVSVNNASAPVWQSVSVSTSGGGSTDGSVHVPRTPEEYHYDLDGNLTSDGRWSYVWDAENRLVQMTPLAGVPETDQRRLNFGYDHQGRRIWKRVDYKVGGAWTTYYERKFLYDGWNLIAELWTNDGVVKKFLWGLDLSGTEQGAGGVGGLLKIWDSYTWKDYFAGYDGNANVVMLVAGTDGTVAGRFEYGPFGEPIRASGNSTIAASTSVGNPFRWSTKYTDPESDLAYYGYRYYNPSTGRWPNRDPIEEEGGRNLYAFDGNDLINAKDNLGLFKGSSLCSAKELAAIRAAESAASSAASTALNVLQTQFKVKHLLGKYPNFQAKWLNNPNFRNDYYAWYRWAESDLKQIVTGFAANNYGVECECWCSKGVWAYVADPTQWLPDDDIHFCPLFFKDTPQNQVKHFLHEVSHLFADTEDLALGGMRPWVDNANDAYWYGEIGLSGGQAVFDSFIKTFSALYP